MPYRLLLYLATLGCLLIVSVGSPQLLASSAQSAIWLEGEQPASANFTPTPEGVGNPQFLSKKAWLKIGIESDQISQSVPVDGILLTYDFNVAAAAEHEIWARIGYEFARSPFEWRLDDATWTPVSPEDLTTDLMELGHWTEIAWLQLGQQALTAGQHTLAFRLPISRDASDKPRRILFALDAVCLTPEPFRPNAQFKPGEAFATPQDLEAAARVFRLPAPPAAGRRVEAKLDGLWEITRHDEQSPGEVAQPIPDLPEHPNWSAITVPGDKNVLRPDLVFAHRLWYRTRVEVPASLAGRAFFVDFPYNNLNTTVYVNGVLCGFEKNPFVRFQIDVTPGIQAGQTNEIWVGIRDAWYGRAADPSRPLKLRKTFNYPLSFFADGFQDLDYPVWNCPQSGLLGTPTLVAAGGPVYATDVFVKPSVSTRQLGAEVTLKNGWHQSVTGELLWEAISDSSNTVAHSFTPKTFYLEAGQTGVVNVSEPWSDPELWWPDSPHLYRLRTTLLIGNQPVDIRETLFGFREWRCQGTQFTLNGVVWHMWADLVGVNSSPQDWLAAYRRTQQRTTRLSTAGQADHDSRWLGLEPQDALEFCDRHGVVVRRNTTLDGERIGYHFSEPDPETRRQQDGSEIKLALMQNWRDQCVAQVRGERNHPSIQIWTLENEFAFINLINLLGNSPNMDRYEQEITRTHDAVRAVDPTRPAMIDGGGATRNNTLSVHGDHYVATLDLRYPDLAYEPFVEGGGRGRWTWDQQRPRFIGEDFFANGINPADYAMWGGEAAFQGKAAARDAVALLYRMLNEGYRWGGYYAAWHFWLGNEGGPAQWVANAPRAAFVRQWDWTFGSTQTVTRTFGLFNDTRHTEPLTFSRRLRLRGREIYAKTDEHEVAPGTARKFDETILLPAVTTREDGELILSVKVKGQEVFRDSKAVSVLPPLDGSAIPPRSIAVLDPSGQATAFLRRLGTDFTPVKTLDALPQTAEVLLVGSDAIDESMSTSTRFAVLASEGRKVIVLDQSHPLKYQAIPAYIELAPTSRQGSFGTKVPTAEGRTAFIEDTSHRAVAGLKQKDFFTWGPDHRVFRNAYLKPTRGAKSLIQAGPRLAYSVLIEVPVGAGILYLTQLQLGDKLDTNPVAQHLLLNLIQAALDYRLEFAEVAATITDPPLGEAVNAMGLRFSEATTPLEAITDPGKKIALVSASPDHLAALAQAAPGLNTFWERGGTLVLCGLNPQGLDDFNRIVGITHTLRPFKRERVTFPAIRHPLTAGLTAGDIVLLSGERIFGWTADEYVASDMFSAVVDLEDMAPFARSGFFAYDKIVNGFVGSDGWPLIIDFDYPKDGSPYEIHLDLPRREALVEYTHDASVNYNATTRIALVFDGRDRLEFDLQPNGEPQSFTIDPPRPAQRVTVQLVNWLSDPAKRPIIGIDNIALRVERSPEWHAAVKPLLNLGGLVYYPKGPGGVVLCNLKFQSNETVPVNRTKKRAILATLLRNLKAPFSGGRTIIAGGHFTCIPLDIHTKATTYKDERGWFGDPRFTFRALPAGEHTLAGVLYSIYEMPTSPVPQILMLQGNDLPANLPQSITGIPVNTRADALFFLHTARIDRELSRQEQQEPVKPELCRYVVHYQDGETTEIPVQIGTHIEHYRQTQPVALPQAQLAWTAPFENSAEMAAAYALQWDNPRPEAIITSIDLVYGQEGNRGVPALIAITAATAE